MPSLDGNLSSVDSLDKHKLQPSMYKHTSEFDQSERMKRGLSFGMPRDKMQKLFIQAIEKESKEIKPGPGQYRLRESLG